jgi:hypothetical protein
MAKFYANENFPFAAVESLRQLGHDELTTAEHGKAGQAIPDADVLGFAITETRILVTLNKRHFIRLHSHTPHHEGIIFCTFDSNFEALAQRIHDAVKIQPTMTGQLVRVNRPSI